jgi:hypothetical protein
VLIMIIWGDNTQLANFFNGKLNILQIEKWVQGVLRVSMRNEYINRKKRYGYFPQTRYGYFVNNFYGYYRVSKSCYR